MIKAELPIQEKMDNLEASFLAHNKNAGKRPKHVDTRHYTRHYVQALIK